jgi:hypothetical protein
MLPPDFEREKRQASPPQGQQGPGAGVELSPAGQAASPAIAGPVTTLRVQSVPA